MFKAYTKSTVTPVITINPMINETFKLWEQRQSERVKSWIAVSGFKPITNSYLLLPNELGELERIIVVVESYDDIWAYSTLSNQLPKGIYRIESANMQPHDYNRAALGWGIGSYRFLRYKKEDTENPQLLINHQYDRQAFESMVEAIFLVRDLINTPAEDMMPNELTKAANDLAHSFGAIVTVTTGKDLITKNYPAIYTVGKASQHAPQLIDFTFGEPQHPKLTLIGKGVCFDSGGLDLKSAKGMELMKKDMAGAAHVLGLAWLIMAAKLPVRLRVLIPAVENALGSSAFHPGDVITMRNGTTVEVGNTDAEGRLVLADALSEAMTEQPDLIIDMASLTGAARVALGPEVPVFFTQSEKVATKLMESSFAVDEAIWRLPLYQPYLQYIKSKIADLNNCSAVEYGGAITAALFLETFVSANVDWIHIDLMGWNISDLPGRKVGAEAMGLRSLFHFLQQRY